jgi:isoprenylcysteine carboxyl methyltransferase (ICMT) family protein YpbQ
MDLDAAEVVLAALLLTRLAEFWIGRRNAERRIAAGAMPRDDALHVATMLFHGGWLVALVMLAEGSGAPDPLWLGAAVVLLALRGWRLAAAPGLWTPRLFRDAPGDVRDPYGVPMIAELLVWPMVFGSWPLALGGALLYAPLAWRRSSESA